MTAKARDTSQIPDVEQQLRDEIEMLRAQLSEAQALAEFRDYRRQELSKMLKLGIWEWDEIAGQPIEKLLDLMKEPEDRVRYRAKIELSARDSNAVIRALDLWMANLDSTDPQWADDVWISFTNETLDAGGGDSHISLQGQGFGERGWAMEQMLRIAADLPDGLTRTNLILAQRGMTSMTHPFLLDGIGFGMNGNDDAYYIEGSDISLFDAGTQSWVKEGDVIDLSGLSPNCPWVAGEGC